MTWFERNLDHWVFVVIALLVSMLIGAAVWGLLEFVVGATILDALLGSGVALGVLVCFVLMARIHP